MFLDKNKNYEKGNLLLHFTHTGRHCYWLPNVCIMKTQRERREEMGAYFTMFIVGACSVACIIAVLQTIFNIF